MMCLDCRAAEYLLHTLSVVIFRQVFRQQRVGGLAKSHIQEQYQPNRNVSTKVKSILSF